MRKTVFAIITSVAAVAALPACKAKSADNVPADNTAKNQRDRAATPTADNSGNSSSDVDVTQKIRKAVMADDSLSTNAHNCKIVVQSDSVSLVGPVASATERSRVEQIAAGVVSDRKIINQLEVAN